MRLQDIVDYVLATPGNTNPALLREMIEKWAWLQDYVKKLDIQKLEDFLYSAVYTSWDYEVGQRYCEQFMPDSTVGACSSVRNGNFYGRNYDWFYNNQRSFIVKCLPYAGRHGSIGIAQAPMWVQPDKILSEKYDENFEVIPFLTVDGINDAGVVCNDNVAPIGDKGYTTGTNAKKRSMCGIMMIRYILDYANSARHAVDLFDKVNIFNIYGDKVQDELHFMVADTTGTYIIEFINNEKHVMSDLDDEFDMIPNNLPIMTNFHLTDFDGETKTGFEIGGIDPSETTLTAHACGVERYNILRDNYEMAIDVPTMFELMHKVRYSNAYDDSIEPYWYSELVGIGKDGKDYTIYLDKSEYANAKEKFIQKYQTRTREKGDTWHTVHNTVYDIENKKMYLQVQESDEQPYEVTFDYDPSEYVLVYDGGEITDYWEDWDPSFQSDNE